MGNLIELKKVIDKSKVSGLPEDFVWFWSEFPRKEKKGDAFKAWKQTSNIRPPVEEIIAAVDKYAEACKFKDAQYIMLPATWLRAWAWTDER